ncbi:hypothetical protein cypCar_00016325 [Cyprinus carpio]|nr:hypothetical protein cypCar_00016325 [Cyprinus carpio]
MPVRDTTAGVYMYSKAMSTNEKITVLVVGLEKAGKTSCVRGMLRVPPGDIGPTHGCVRTELRVENYLVNILDMGGAPEVRGSWREHYGEAHGIIFVVDSSDRQQMKEVKEALVDLLKHPRVAGKPLLVTRTSKTDIRQEQHNETVRKNGTLQPIKNILNKEDCLKKKLSKKKKVKVKIKKESPGRGVNEDEVEETEGNEAEQDHNSQKDKASSALLPPKRRKMKRKAKVKEENSGLQESPNSEVSRPSRGKGERMRKKKTVKVKRKNKINTEEVPAAYAQPVDLSTTFDLYRKAILALKARQEQDMASG